MSQADDRRIAHADVDRWIEDYSDRYDVHSSEFDAVNGLLDYIDGRVTEDSVTEATAESTGNVQPMVDPYRPESWPLARVTGESPVADTETPEAAPSVHQCCGCSCSACDGGHCVGRHTQACLDRFFAEQATTVAAPVPEATSETEPEDECEICGEVDHLTEIQTLSNPLNVCHDCADSQVPELLNTIRAERADHAAALAKVKEDDVRMFQAELGQARIRVETAQAERDEARAALAKAQADGVAAEETAWAEARRLERLAYLPCSTGCGCVTADDPDRRDCACDGPCCIGDAWPISALAGFRYDVLAAFDARIARWRRGEADQRETDIESAVQCARTASTLEQLRAAVEQMEP